MSDEKRNLREDFSRWGQKIKEFAEKRPAFIENRKIIFHTRKQIRHFGRKNLSGMKNNTA